MKNSFILILILIFTLSGDSGSWATDPPSPPSDHGSSGDNPPEGGGAPIEDSALLILGLSAIYFGYKRINQVSLESQNPANEN